ncbi:hypothetical protein C8Q75DRAFT_786916 [Abortiporus biennis]|nr:hypothetical protein C8Q75DRAFT_786916 [Abortiporus biennis]
MSESAIPLLPYRLFFLYIEPISAVLGACYAAGLPITYLNAFAGLSSDINHSPPPTPTLVALYQLSNLYLLFALNEHLVLSSTDSIKTWKRLLFVLLVADFGHLATMWPMAIQRGLSQVYLDVLSWNIDMWGNVGFVYIGATMRICFLLGIGLQKMRTVAEKKKE